MRWGHLALGACGVAVLLRAVTACMGDDPERIASSPDAGGPPGGQPEGGSTPPGADANASACALDRPFGELKSLGPVINTAAHEYPGRFSGDLLSFVFARRSVADGEQPQIFVARRAAVDAAFATAEPAFAPTGAHDQEPSFTPWGAIVFHRGEQGSTQLMIAAPADGGFAAPVALGGAINLHGTERSPYVAADGTLYFARAPRDAGAVSNGYDLFMSPANDDRSFASASPVPGLARPDTSETLPVVNGAGTRLYFSQVFNYDADGGAKSDITIFRAERSSVGEPFGEPQPVPGVNSAGYDTTAWVSEDDCTIVIARRPADAGHIDLFVGTRPATE